MINNYIWAQEAFVLFLHTFQPAAPKTALARLPEFHIPLNFNYLNPYCTYETRKQKTL